MMAFGAGMAHAGIHAAAPGNPGRIQACSPHCSAASRPAPASDANTAADGTPVTAELGGTVVRWLADDGAPVREGAPIVVLETMKMEREALAPATGTLHITVPVGEQADYGAVLGTID